MMLYYCYFGFAELYSMIDTKAKTNYIRKNKTRKIIILSLNFPRELNIVNYLDIACIDICKAWKL